MLITCLLITGIAGFSGFFVPPDRTDIKDGPEICEGYIDSLQPQRLIVSLRGCKDGDLLRPMDDRVQLTMNGPDDQDEIARPEGPRYRYGDVVRFRAALHQPRDYKNPGGFRYRRYTASKGITLTGYIEDPRWITVIGRVEGHYLKKGIERIRERISEPLERMSDGDLKGVARALLIGDGSTLSERIKDDFRRSGLMHILVISGLNVAFVALAAFFFFKRLLLLIPCLAFRCNVFKPAAVLTVLFVWLYVGITGAEVSVVRAGIMATVYLAGIIFDRRQDIFTSLAMAALIIIAISPLAVFDISFQLSFVCVLAIAVIHPRLAGRIALLRPAPCETFWRRLGRYVLGTAAVSAAATLGAAPLLAYHFHYSSFAGVLANILVVPWAGFVVTPLGLVAGTVAAVSPEVARVPVLLWGHLLVPIMKAASFSASVSEPFTLALTPPWPAVIMFYAAVLMLLLRKHFRFAYASAAVCSLLFAASFAVQKGWFEPKMLKVAFLDVGQGSAVVAKFPDGRVMVIDGGGTRKGGFDTGKFIVAPYLWHDGISRVDTVVSTHTHPDHFRGLGFIADNFSPREFIWNGVAPEEPERKDWSELFGRIGAARTAVRAGHVAQGPGYTIEFLSPPGNIPDDWSINDTSIVMRIIYGDISFLLTGDIEGKAEEYLVRELAGPDRAAKGGGPRITVLQVPHHGSRTSSSPQLIHAAGPRYAVIQCGNGNLYGFPDKDVVARLNGEGAKIYVTGNSGAVTFGTDGKRLKVSDY